MSSGDELHLEWFTDTLKLVECGSCRRTKEFRARTEIPGSGHARTLYDHETPYDPTDLPGRMHRLFESMKEGDRFLHRGTIYTFGYRAGYYGWGMAIAARRSDGSFVRLHPTHDDPVAKLGTVHLSIWDVKQEAA